MSGLYALFGKATKRIRQNHWGAKIPVDANGAKTTNPIEKMDSAVQPAIDELNAALNDLDPIDIAEPVVMNYGGLGFGMAIKTATGKGIEVTGTGGSATFNAVNGMTGMARMIDDTDGKGIEVKDDPNVICLRNIWIKVQTLVFKNGFVINRTKPIKNNPSKVGTIDLRKFCDCAAAGIAPCPECCVCPCDDFVSDPKPLPITMYVTLVSPFLVSNCDIWQGGDPAIGFYYVFSVTFDKDSKSWKGAGPNGCSWEFTCIDIGANGQHIYILTTAVANGGVTSNDNWRPMRTFSCAPFFARAADMDHAGDYFYLESACGCNHARFSMILLKDVPEIPNISNIFPP